MTGPSGFIRLIVKMAAAVTALVAVIAVIALVGAYLREMLGEAAFTFFGLLLVIIVLGSQGNSGPTQPA